MTHEILRQAPASAAPNKDAVLTDSSQQPAQTSVVMVPSHSNDYLREQDLPNKQWQNTEFHSLGRITTQ